MKDIYKGRTIGFIIVLVILKCKYYMLVLMKIEENKISNYIGKLKVHLNKSSNF